MGTVATELVGPNDVMPGARLVVSLERTVVVDGTVVAVPLAPTVVVVGLTVVTGESVVVVCSTSSPIVALVVLKMRNHLSPSGSSARTVHAP